MFPNHLSALQSSLLMAEQHFPPPTEDPWLASLLLKDIYEDLHHPLLPDPFPEYQGWQDKETIANPA